VSSNAARLFVTFPEELVSKPMIYEVSQRFEVVPNIRRANVEAHSGWMILELDGAPDARENAVAWLVEQGCLVNPMEGDVVAG
jgi:L-aspartate semialdehyde sulfurtransferase ferredoxin